MYTPGRRTTDEAAYAEKYQRQRGPGAYQYESPYPTQPTAFPMDAWIRPQSSGAPISAQYLPVDVETDMRGIGRPVSRAPSDAITLAADPRFATGSAVGHGGHHTRITNPVRVDASDPASGVAGWISSTTSDVIGHVDVPHLRTTHGRLTHPALALKGVGINRFDPVLFHNPAEKAFVPFDRVVNTRLVSKDQWRLPACSLNRLKLMTHQVGSETPIHPVFTNPDLPGEDASCIHARATLAKQYSAKAVQSEPAPTCYSQPPTIAPLPTDSNGCYGGGTQTQMESRYYSRIVERDPMPSCG